jgi:hypothetical protein
VAAEKHDKDLKACFRVFLIPHFRNENACIYRELSKMPFRRYLNVLVMISAFLLSASAGLSAAEQYGWVYGRYRGPVPYYVGNPKSVDIVPAAVSANTNQSHPMPPGGANVPAYPYGYFGAQYRPYTVSNRNYYNDFSQLSFRRGY